MKNLVIYGAGGFGREVAWLVENINKQKQEWNVLGFIDDGKADLFGKTINGLPLLGGREWFDVNTHEVYVTCALGSSKIRRKIYSSLAMLNHVKLATLVDPSVAVADTASIGEGSIVCHGSRVMVNARVGKGVVINVGSLVGHDSEISSYSTLLINVMISGMVKVGENSEIGSGAFIREKLAISNDVVVAPLSSVLRDISEPGTYAGNPARRMI